MERARFVVRGKVQGVFFRASTRERALQLQINGRATNLADGSVEVIAEGSQPSLQILADWLQQGPPLARVEQVERQDWTSPVAAGFIVD